LSHNPVGNSRSSDCIAAHYKIVPIKIVDKLAIKIIYDKKWHTCFILLFNSLLAQLVKYDVYTTRKTKFIHAIFYHILLFSLYNQPMDCEAQLPEELYKHFL